MYKYITTEEELKRIVRDEIKPYCASQKQAKLAVDLETYNIVPGRFKSVLISRTGEEKFEAGIALIQIGADPQIFNCQWIIDVKSIPAHTLKDELTDILESNLIIGQNFKYDFGFLISQLGIYPKTIRDTYIIHKILTAGDNSEASLGALYKKYLDYGWFFSATGKSFDDYMAHKTNLQVSDWSQELSEEQLQYAADDVSLIFALYDAQKEELKKFVTKHNKSGIYDLIKLECDVIPEVALMELRGLKYDVEYIRREVLPYLTKKAEAAMVEAQKRLPHKVILKGRGKAKVEHIEYMNPRSPKLKEVFKLPDCKAETLKNNRQKHPAIPFVLDYKKAAHMISSFGENYIELLHTDGRHHPDYFQIGTDTGRFSAARPNIMQIPAREILFGEISSAKLFRSAYIADDGYVIIDADFSAIEPRLIAEAFNVKQLVKAFCDGVDYHGFTAQILLNLSEPAKRGTMERDQLGKTANLALGYKAGAAKVASLMLKYTVDSPNPIYWDEVEAQEKMDRYFEALPEVLEAQKDIENKVRASIDCHDSLQDFRGRKPIYTQFTRVYKRPRTFFLSDKQEELARNVFPRGIDPAKHPLHKYHQVIKEDGTTSTYNDYKKTKGNTSREAYNHIIQGEQATLLKLTMKLFGEKQRSAGCFDLLREGITAVIHDEVVAEFKKENSELAQKLLRESMEEAGKVFLKKVPVEISLGVGSCWYLAK